MCKSYKPSIVLSLRNSLNTQSVLNVVFYIRFKVNRSELDWNFTAEIEGEGFTGPPSFIAPAQTTSSYPLCFQPVYEGKVEVTV